jgi:hypothetical protein
MRYVMKKKKVGTCIVGLFALSELLLPATALAEVPTTWRDLAAGTPSSTGAYPAHVSPGNLDLFSGWGSEYGPALVDGRSASSGGSWTLYPIHWPWPTWEAVQVSAASNSDNISDTLWRKSDGSLVQMRVQSDSWTTVGTVPWATGDIIEYSTIGWPGESWFSMFYTTGSNAPLKHRWYDRGSNWWSGEEILLDPSNQSISDVDPNYRPMAIFDGVYIRIFYVRQSDHKIKVRDYPYDGDWSRVSSERCTGQTISEGGSFGATWDGTHKTGRAYLVFPLNGQIRVNWSENYAQGSWHTDSSYTLTSGHQCVSHYSAISFFPGRVEVFCSTASGVVRAGSFGSFG